MTLLALVLLHLIPQPARLERLSCRFPAAALGRVAPGFDPAARAELDERWTALGLSPLRTSAAEASILVRRVAGLPREAYRLTVGNGRAVIESSDADGAFYGAMTLAQLPARSSDGWTVPCVAIEDRPALAWRVLSDDVSRGPLPTMTYFRQRIRTIAAFKMNGYSPYMEHVFVSPTDPLAAPLDGITPAQLRDLAAYAARFHVALIPQQQTLAHMHGTLRVEQYAGGAATPHGFLISPSDAAAQSRLARVIAAELEAVPHPPFFHIGSDEAGVTPSEFSGHIAAMNRIVRPSGARLMLWDDAIQNDASILSSLPRSAVVADFHYGAEPSFARYIDRVASGGREQMVAPGANNWNEIYPRISTAIANERVFAADGKRARVLGLFETVWHDDGETLYESTWYPVIYAAAAAWQPGEADPARYAADFPAAFFGVDDARYARDVERLDDAQRRLTVAPYDASDALFWSDAFDDAADKRMQSVDLRAVRLSAEAVEADLYFAKPPLHGAAAFAMFLAARRYDALARKFQIASEVRELYADAVAHSSDTGGAALRDLYWCRYWMWELRDSYEELAPLYSRAWTYESRGGHLASNLERYHLAAQRAIALADAFYRATYDGYVRNKTLPAFEEIVR
ncbi:MAG: beta-N-acetylhexosaminidase [Candidatus Eremiobacteraeota bacterium]|nr:beta-N-acetylhexosaminidase [Candidatus Eremiobacteraeota bacterium]